MARLQMSSDIAHDNWNKYGTGGGASPFSTYYENLLVSNQDTSFIGQTLEGGSLIMSMKGGMPTITPGNVWNIFINGTVDVFNSNFFESSAPGTLLRFRITDSNGDAWETANQDVSTVAAGSHSLREQWVDDTYQLDCTNTGNCVANGDTPNQCWIILTGDVQTPPAYAGFTYFAIEIASHTITASSDAHSAWDHEGANTVSDGGSLTVNASVDPGYLIADVLVDGVSVGDAAGASTYQKIFSSVTADHTISVTAAIPVTSTSVVTATQAAGSGGTVTANVASAVTGQTVRYTIRPGHGQRTSRFEVGGVSKRNTVDPLVGGGVTYGVAMDAGTPIEYDYVLPPSPALLAVFDRVVNSATSYTYDSQIAHGMGTEDLATRSGKLRPRDYNV
jgi:hypothetical protein